jgi:pSer/pThr/pTyr-binding forkhead associated (FHA) protein
MVKPAPRLIFSTPDAPHNQEFVIDSHGLYTVGAAADSDVRIDSSDVSNRHALIAYADDVLTVQDLNSPAGTHVNGVRITGPTPLGHGARIGLGPVDLELRIPGAAPPAPVAPGPISPPPATYDIRHQQAQEINQAGRDQYIYRQQRYELRIAPMLDRARRLLRAGVALMLAAVGIYLVTFVLFGREIIETNEAISEAVRTQQEPDMPDISFGALAMLPVAFVLGFVGFVMVVVALMTRRRARQEEREL